MDEEGERGGRKWGSFRREREREENQGLYYWSWFLREMGKWECFWRWVCVMWEVLCALCV